MASLMTIVMLTLSVSAQPPNAKARKEPAVRIDQLERKVRSMEAAMRQLEYKIRDFESMQRKILDESGNVAAVLFFFGVFCALWAQNSRRNAVLWFFFGIFFNFIAAFVLLSKNSDDIRAAKKRKFSEKMLP